jgi:hypothetical protein
MSQLAVTEKEIAERKRKFRKIGWDTARRRIDYMKKDIIL